MRENHSSSKELVIAISGHHGSGRSTHAIRLGEVFGLRYISSGTIFRDMAKERGISLEKMSKLTEDNPQIDRLIDERTKEESKTRGVVVDATLAGWMVHKPNLRFFLTAPFEERIKRISLRENISIENARRETKVRSESEKERFIVYYGIDITDLSIYDLVLNTNLFSSDGTAHILKSLVDEYLKER